MNNPLDPTLRELNDCGCCAGTGAQTPAATSNRPGLPAIRFRAGVHSQFKATLLAALSSPDHPALSALHTRESNDFTPALLDAFASMADVLTFYSERIANEAYLRTATERSSVLELARAIGYELAPGVAAQVLLAFTVEGGRGASGTAILPRHTKVQSLPGPGEKPQLYETSVEFAAQAAWNELRPRRRAAPPRPEDIPRAAQLYLAGTATNLKRGDLLLLSSGKTAHARRIVELVVDRDKNHTYVRFEASSNARPAAVVTNRAALDSPPGSLQTGLKSTKDNVAGLFLADGVLAKKLFEYGHFHDWDVKKVQQHLNSLPRVTLFPANAGVFALRARLGFFGHNAPKWQALPKEMTGRGNAYPNDWDTLTDERGFVSPCKIWQDSQGSDLNPPKDRVPDPQFDVLIERPVPEAVAGSWLVLETASSNLVPLRIGRNTELSRADFAMSAKCARLNLKGVDGKSDPGKDSAYTTRGTTAHLLSEPLEVVGEPITADLTAGMITIELDTIETSLVEGQTLALQGEDADLPGTTQRELIFISTIRHTSITILTLSQGLLHSYVRSSVTLNANVVPATHGETTQEVLGSGDAAQPFQRFTLKQKPLTVAFLPGGSKPESSLEIWVDDVKWRESAAFFNCGPNDRVYVVRQADDGTATVQFGDGRRGARLPTGRENVRAVYRKGIGLEGLVKEDQVSLLVTQPLGAKGVTNPLAPQGAEDPQSLDDARVNAPRTVLTLDRVVSLQDYEDFARDFPGVDKAQAAWTWSGQTRGVLLTLLGPGGHTISELGQPAEPLRTSLARQGIPRVPVRIVSRPPSLFAVTGIVRVDADRVPSVVAAAVRSALLAAFSFAAREFGRGVHLSEVIAVIQNVPGVAFVDVTNFQKTYQEDAHGPTLTVTAKNGYLSAHQPANGVDALLAKPAELLILDESSLPQLEVKLS